MLKAVILAVLFLGMGVAGCANVATGDKASPGRFVDNGDGTITDTATGLMWEKKTGTVGREVLCSTPTTCPDPTNVNNRYTWPMFFTDYLAKLNCTDLQFEGTCGTSDPSTGRVTRYHDWRIPTFAEFRTVLTGDYLTCWRSTCIDPIFSPTAFYYWSSSYAHYPSASWYVHLGDGRAYLGSHQSYGAARAVRGGT